ncbi:MAG: glycosyltransferase family 2 protein [Deltaproteobacteria bacterium]|nr:glycosyltransferase family 2 protein [Deltaproteobacteria bacterium]
MKKVSVLILSYNLEKYIREAVLSALNQNGVSHDELEIVIVEDGSADNSRGVIKGLIREYPGAVKLIDLGRNTGIMPAAMEGLKHLTGKYVCLLDADDVWHEDKLSEVIPCLDAGYDLVLHEGEFVDSSGNFLRSAGCRVRDEDIAGRIRTFNGGAPLGSCVSFRKSSLDMGLLSAVYDKFKAKGIERNLHQDFSMVHNLLSRKGIRVKCVRKNLYKYRIHEGNTSQHSDFEDAGKLRKTYDDWMAGIQFAIETYRLTGIFNEDKSIDIGFRKFLYHKNLTFREKPLIKLWSDYIFLLRNRAFSSSNEKLREALYPFFYRLSPKLRGFIRRRAQL